MRKTIWSRDPKIEGNPAVQYIQLCIYLFLFWMLISGSLHLRMILIGIVASVVVAGICMPVLMVRNADRTKKYYILSAPVHALIGYAIWLLKELILANLDVASSVLKKQMPIDPIVLRFRVQFDNPIAVAMLANSITLTPGTITMEAKNGLFEVHTLTPTAAEGLKSGNMIRRIAALYHESGEFVVLEDLRSIPQ